jgi:type IV fimbrial biogenesis protein FimT
MCNNPKPASGFTLLELIVTITVAGILMAIAIPNFYGLIRNNRLTTYTNEFVSSLNLARSEAIKRGLSVSVRKIGGTGTYWSTSGWNVFVDDGAGTTANKDNGKLDTNEQILRVYPALPSYFILAGNNNFVNFIRYKADGSSNSFGSFAVCDMSANDIGDYSPKAYASRLIIIRQLGRIRIGKDTNGDGIPEDDTNSALTSCISP